MLAFKANTASNNVPSITNNPEQMGVCSG